MNKEAPRKRRFHLDPRIKVLILVLIATVEMFSLNIWVMTAIGLIPVFLYLTDHRVSGAIKYSIVFGLSVLAHIFRADIQLNMVLNMVIVLLGGFVLKLFPAFATGEYILKSTSVSEMMSAFSAIGLNRKMLIPLSVMFRFFPTIRREHAAIHDAAMMRGVSIGRKRFWKNPGQAFEYRIIPLMITVANIGNDLSAAALSRGLDNPARHTTYTDVKIGITDVVTLICIIAVVTAVFVFTTLM
ncbi:MAG: energy-coupling factor transporter transmembrane protein EcfT [Lachnospiraceae bacterium]|nr:energy-coupling factor transporter transmembrane protein EcfT [Lachnospiraceae bacterium]